MKRLTVILGMCIAITAHSADPLTRLLPDPNAFNSTIGFENVPPVHANRIVKGEEVNLQPLFTWISRGRIQRGKKVYTEPNPLPDWRPVDGTIINVMDDAVLIARGISKTPVIVKNYPKVLRPAEGAPASIVAVEAGLFDFTTKDGAKQAVQVFDYGIPVARPAPVATNAPVDISSLTNFPPAKSPKPGK